MASTSNETNFEGYEDAEKKLNDLMNEYLAMKKNERKVSEKKLTNFSRLFNQHFFLILKAELYR